MVPENQTSKVGSVPVRMKMNLLEVAELFERSLVWEIRRSECEDDAEGARLKALTLVLVRDAIATAKARG